MLTPLGGLSNPVTPIPLPLSDLADIAVLLGVILGREDTSDVTSTLLSHCMEDWVSLLLAAVADMLTTFSALAIEPNTEDKNRAWADLYYASAPFIAQQQNQGSSSH